MPLIYLFYKIEFSNNVLSERLIGSKYNFEELVEKIAKPCLEKFVLSNESVRYEWSVNKNICMVNRYKRGMGLCPDIVFDCVLAKIYKVEIGKMYEAGFPTR